MHVKIAMDIQQKQRETIDRKSVCASTNIGKTYTTHSKSSKSSSSSRSSEPPNTVNQACASKSSSVKNPIESVNALPNSVRPASTTNLNPNYPGRYGTPFGTSSISAPPILPGFFPPTMPSSMHLSGYMQDCWPRPPIPVSLAVSVTSANRAPYSLSDYYSMSSASSALSAWAAGIKPPGSDSNASNKQSVDNHKPLAPSINNHKRKQEDLEYQKLSHRTSSRHSSISSNSIQNGDMRNELAPHKKSIHSTTQRLHKTDSVGNNSRTSLENEVKAKIDHSLGESVRSKQLFDSKPDTRFTNFNSNTPAPPTSFANTGFFPSFPVTSDHQRYLDYLSMPMNSTLPPPSSLSPATNSFMSSRNNVDLSSRPLWSYNMPPPPTPSSSSTLAVVAAAMASPSMMPDPFKSLQDISLRPGLVTPDRDTLFSRYSLLNSSGGGASIFDKLTKEQLDKFEMMQNQNKDCHSSNAPSNISKQLSHSIESSVAVSSRSTPSQRVLLHPPPPTSLPSAPTAPSSTPFPYPSPYLNPLHQLTSGNSYLSQPMSHPSFVSGNVMLNGGDSLSKLALGSSGSSGLSSSPSSQFILPPHFSSGPGGMVNFMKPDSASLTPFSHSTR